MIPSPLLVVTDRHGPRPLVETVRAVLDGGARWIWFRDRDWEAGARRGLAADLLAIVRDAGGRLTIGGDVTLATEIGADGVHLGGSVFAEPSNGSPTHPPHPEVPASAGLEGALQTSSSELSIIPRSGPRFAEKNDAKSKTSEQAIVGEPANACLEGSFEAAASRRHLRMRERVGGAVSSARRHLGANALIGLSAHSLADIRAAAEAGADYVTLSPIFTTASKPGYGPALGLDALRAASELGIPVIALGGIDAANAGACRKAGASGVAVMGGLMRAEDPAEAARALLAALG